jgi:hypothetical protein
MKYIKMPRRTYVKEHKRLIRILKSGTGIDTASIVGGILSIIAIGVLLIVSVAIFSGLCF